MYITQHKLISARFIELIAFLDSFSNYKQYVNVRQSADLTLTINNVSRYSRITLTINNVTVEQSTAHVRCITQTINNISLKR